MIQRFMETHLSHSTTTWMDLVQLMGHRLGHGSQILFFPVEFHRVPTDPILAGGTHSRLSQGEVTNAEFVILLNY